MQIPVLIEKVAGNGYRARGGEPLGLCAEGPTREEAVSQLHQLYQARLAEGAELLVMNLGPQAHPWMEFAGMFKDDPDFKEVQEIIAENRRKMDDDPNVL